MSESVPLVTVTRTLLSLGQLNVHASPFRLGSPDQDLELGTVTWVRDHARSPDLHGAVLVQAQKDVVEGCTIDVDVTGANQGEIRTNVDALVAAFEQFTYTMTVTLDGVSRAWACEPADSLEGVLKESNTFGLICPVRLVFNRSPIRLTSVPPAPTIGAVTALSPQTVAVAWTSNGDGGGPLASSTITPYIGAAAQTPQVLGATSPQTVTGLSPSTTYTFKVKLTNIYGTGPDSAASDAVSTPAVTVPNAPTIGTAAAGPGAGGATVNWARSTYDGGTVITSQGITAYRASDNVSLGIQAVGATLTTYAYAAGTFTSGVPIYFKVHSANGIGLSPQSAASNTVTPT